MRRCSGLRAKTNYFQHKIDPVTALDAIVTLSQNLKQCSLSIIHDLLILDFVRVDKARHSCSSCSFLCGLFFCEKLTVVRASKLFCLHMHRFVTSDPFMITRAMP